MLQYIQSVEKTTKKDFFKSSIYTVQLVAALLHTFVSIWQDKGPRALCPEPVRYKLNRTDGFQTGRFS